MIPTDALLTLGMLKLISRISADDAESDGQWTRLGILEPMLRLAVVMEVDKKCFTDGSVC